MSFKTVAYLGLRPFKPKKHGVKGVILHTILVVAIAMLPLVVVVMVADGMIKGITSRYIETSSYHLRIYSRQPADVLDYEQYNYTLNSILELPNVTSATIERMGAAVGVLGNVRNGVYLRGVDPNIYNEDSGFREFVTVESGDFDLSDPNNVVISGYQARKLGANVGDTISIITGRLLNNGRVLPRVTMLNVTGIVKTGYEDLDKLWIFVSFDQSVKMLPNKSSDTFIGIKTTDAYSSTLDETYLEIRDLMPSGWIIRMWSQLNRNTYENFKTTQTVLSLIMGLIVIVAAINISSSLVMLVLERRRDIAILKGMGLSPNEVMGSYLLTGIVIGVIGTIIGVVFGVLISLNINQLIDILETVVNTLFRFFNFIFNRNSSNNFVLLESEYYLDTIPVELNHIKLLIMTFFSIITTAIASFIPARKAGVIKPLKIMQKY